MHRRTAVAAHRQNHKAVADISLITCPHCGTAKREQIPADACQYFYDCSGCGQPAQAQAGQLSRVLLLRLVSLPARAARARIGLLRPGAEQRRRAMKWHTLEGQDWAKVIGVGLAVSILTAAFMVATMKAGISPLSKSLGLAFAEAVLDRPLPLPVGSCFTPSGARRFRCST